MKSVLITGGLGFVGGRLSRKLTTEFAVMVTSRMIPDAGTLAAHGKVRSMIHADLLKSFPSGIDTVIHLAALNEIDCSLYPSEAIRVNVDETRIILENAIKAGVTNFIYFSTAHVYGAPLEGTITEESIPTPVHPYAITHKAAEDYVIAAAKQRRISAVVIRLSNSFGSPVIPTVNRWTLLANDLARQATVEGRLTLKSNGCQFRDFVTLTDVENAVSEMLSIGINKFEKIVYNLGAGKSLRVIDMANEIVRAYEELYQGTISVELPPDSRPTRETELFFSNERLSNAGIVIKNDWTAELKELLIFCQRHFGKKTLTT